MPGGSSKNRKFVKKKPQGEITSSERVTGVWHGIIDTGESMWNIPGSMLRGSSRKDLNKSRGKQGRRVKARVDVGWLGQIHGSRWGEGILSSDSGDSVAYRLPGFVKRESSEKPEGAENRRGKGRDAHCRRVLRISGRAKEKKFSANKTRDCKRKDS